MEKINFTPIQMKGHIYKIEAIEADAEGYFYVTKNKVGDGHPPVSRMKAKSEQDIHLAIMYMSMKGGAQ